jgi:UDP-N-acetyl-2-amino-2-deoxyglucuronate dehydrogenase
MNILIIGFGTAGKHYLNLLKKFKEVKKVFICDKASLKVSKDYEILKFDKKIIKEKKISHAIICTPSNQHFEFAQKLIKIPINILIEKPFVLKLSHAKKLINLSKKTNTKCWVAFQNRHNLAIDELKRIILSKKIGKIFLVDCSLFWKRDLNYYKVSWKGKYKTDGGVLSNQAIHLLDALIYIFGKVKKFNAIMQFNKKKLEAEDLIIINFLHQNNLVSSFKATTRSDSNYRSSMDIVGEKGRVLVKGISLNTFHFLESSKILDDKNKSENFGVGSGPIGAMGNGHKKILAEFLNSKIKKSSKNLEISKNLHVLDVVHSVYNSTKRDNLNLVTNKQSKLGK